MHVYYIVCTHLHCLLKILLSKCRFYDRSQLHELHAVTIINLLLCRFESVPVGVFKTSHFLYHNHLKQFYNCVRGLRDDDASMGEKCIPSLRQKCEKGSSRVIKLITVRMEAISHVMKLLPEVYVIHLVRDPRGALLSQINVGQVDKSKISNESESHCSNLKKDVAVTKRDICFRRNFYRQRYEDLAREPLQQFSGLFEFVNLKFHQFVQNKIRSIAMAKGVVRRCLYCSDKGDAQAASQRWRSAAHFSTVTEIQKQCAGVMAELGYIQVNSTTHLKDTNVSLTL